MSALPRIELVPSRAAVCNDETVTLDVLVRITPELPEIHFPRPRLNLSLVLDRSGSMAEGKKMPYARQAAVYVVEQLLPTDRVSVVAFDNVVEIVVPGALATDKPGIIRRINEVGPRGSTDLQGGWAEGARQTAEAHATEGINRVLLLSDGLANHGVTDPNVIRDAVKASAALGVSTTTLGVGDDYNEDLMEAIAAAGDGNYYFIETPTQLMDLFQTELHGLMATSGQKVSLGLEPGDGVTVMEVLNDLEKLATGRLKLPNMVVGMPVQILVRLSVPARKMAGTLLQVRLAWNDPRVAQRQAILERLGGMPALAKSDWDALAVDPAVREQVALLMAARAQKEASLAHERDDLAGTQHWLAASKTYTSMVPASPATTDELTSITLMEEALARNDSGYLRKFSKYRSYLRRQSRSTLPEPPSEPPSEA